MNKESSVINFWRAVELFEPRDISGKTADELFEIASDDDFLWNKNENPKFVYQIFCGVTEIKKIIENFEKLFGKDEYKNLGRENKGKIAVFAFKTDYLGQYIPESFALSSLSWLLGKTLKSGYKSADWLNGFDENLFKLSEYFEQRMALLTFEKAENAKKQLAEGTDEHIQIEPLSFLEIENETRLLCEKIGLESTVIPSSISYKIIEKHSANSSVNTDTDMLNSFFQKDLGFIANQVKREEYGSGLRGYLTSDYNLDKNSRIDLENSITTLFEKLSPELIVSGCWAEKKLNLLAFSQQFAVNAIMEKLGGNDSGLFSVNGPPGTGKTTMLKDVIAAVVVNRAKTLAEYSDPSEAFSKGVKWKKPKSNFTHYIDAVDDTLKKTGIVVASSNNKAVQNISKEFPIKEKFNLGWQKEFEYFSEEATFLLGEPAWGLISATLGKSENKKIFTKGFLDKDTSFMKILVRAQEQSEEARKNYWEIAVEKFNEALRREEAIRRSKMAAFNLIIEKYKLKNKISKSIVDEKHLRKDLETIQNQVKSHESNRNNLVVKQNNLVEQKARNDGNRPSSFSVILSLISSSQTLKNWRTEDENIQTDLLSNSKRIFDTEQNKKKSEDELKKLDEEIHQLRDVIEKDTQRLNQITTFLEKEYAESQNSIPNLEIWMDKSKREERELSTPWTSKEWNSARINVFAKALQLQKIFILANAKSIKKNLTALGDLLQGQIPGDHTLEGASDVWATLFLVIPVVSTTFASLDRLFKHLGREEIGWLLIDEAGQAVPQAAVGGIWRSQRTVIVGDPLQLEPVSTIPDKMQETLAEKFAVSDTWLPGNTSVQALADRVNNLGTYIKNNDDQTWVGSPLRVHRRCLNPMFDISNKIAYGGMMVYGTPPLLDYSKLKVYETQPPLPDYSKLPPSCWLDIRSKQASGHWIPAEGIAAENLIDDLIGEYCRPQDIYLISPFSQVAAKLRRIGKNKKVKDAGTIHTTQGRENEVIILVLGGNPDKPGAKSWASEKPNLLNVAVSRAKKRLYVIGNRKEWSKYKYFNVLDSKL